MKTAASGTILVWISLVMVSLFFTGLSYAEIDLETAVGIWLFDDDDDVAEDMSGKGNDGTLKGNPKWVKGVFGEALELDGIDDYVDCGFADSLAMTDEITVMSWFRTDKKMSTSADRQAVVGKHYLEYEVGIYPNGAVHTYTNDGTGAGYDEGINTAVPDATWVLGQWYHLAWTLDGTHETVYVDGIMIGEFDKPHAGTLAGEHSLEIGRRQGGSLDFIGAVDEVVVLNVALGETDIQSVITQGFGATAVSPSGKLATTWAAVKGQ